MHYILACNELLYKWKIVPSSLCFHCKQHDDYKHFFFSCSYNVQYWHKVDQLLTLLKVDKHIFSLESLVTGYKIEDEDYFDMNYLLTIIYFSIYKAYYMSDKKDKVIDIFKIFSRIYQYYLIFQSPLTPNAAILQIIHSLARQK